MSSTEQPIDVIVLSGFLGSGKTTLINRLISAGHLREAALVINEFGEVGLDQFFVQAPSESTLLLENGCVCCTIRGDLIDTIADLLARADNGDIPAFSRVLVETTGLADPGPIVSVIRRATGLRRPLRLAKVIVTVDGVLGTQQIQSNDDVIAQIAHADLCLVTKAELVDPNIVNRLMDDIRALNPATRVAILPRDASADALENVLAAERLGADPRSPESRFRIKMHPQPVRHRAINSWSVDIVEPLAWAAFRNWVDLLYSLHPSHLMRMKAILNLTGHDTPLVIHGVGPLVSTPERMEAWPTPIPSSRIVVITRGLSSAIVERSFQILVQPDRVPNIVQDARAIGSDASDAH